MNIQLPLSLFELKNVEHSRIFAHPQGGGDMEMHSFLKDHRHSNEQIVTCQKRRQQLNRDSCRGVRAQTSD